MPDFLLRDIPEETMTALRRRAERNGRSLQLEIQATLADSVPMPREQWLAEAAALRARTTFDPTPAVEHIRAGREERDAHIQRALDDLNRNHRRQ